VGGDRHYRDPDRPVAPGRPKGAGGGRPREVPEQPQAARPSHPQLRVRPQRAAARPGQRPGKALTAYGITAKIYQGWGGFILPYVEQDAVAKLYDLNKDCRD